LIKDYKIKLMQVFELYFNAGLQSDLIFESFCYEPENIYERRVGSLFMVGALKNALPKNHYFLNKLSKVIKEKYYSPTAKSPEKSFKESLRRANQYLEDYTKSGDVSWLGHLSFSVLSLKNSGLNFTKVGDLKIFLLREGKVVDIDKKIKLEDIEPYPLKIFLNIVTGKLAENDIILIFTKEIFAFFQEENILSEIAEMVPFEEKKFREILNRKKDVLSKVSGICLLIYLTREILKGKKEAIVSKAQAKEFSLKEIFSPLLTFFEKIKLPEIRLPSIQIKPPTITPPKFHPLQTISLKIEGFKAKTKAVIKNKNTILVVSFILLLIIGFVVFQKEREEKLKEYQNQLNIIKQQLVEAESFLIVKSPHSSREAELIFKEEWEEISRLSQIAYTLPQSLREEIFSLKEQTEKELYQLNNLVEIEEPELFFEFSAREFVPHRIILERENFYFINPFAQVLFKLNENKEPQLLQINQKLDEAVMFEDSILFFSKAGTLFVLRNGALEEIFSLKKPYSDFNFDSFSIFKSNLYFLDKKIAQIVKYPYLGNLIWDLPTIWLEPETKKTILAQSIVVDGSIWVLSEKSIARYYDSKFQETLNLDFFPYPKNFSKIFTSTSLPYLYLLEPAEARVVILNKTGNLIHQFKSGKFDNLLDFAVSEDGKTIYLLNGLKVYQVQF